MIEVILYVYKLLFKITTNGKVWDLNPTSEGLNVLTRGSVVFDCLPIGLIDRHEVRGVVVCVLNKL